jgi:tRNA-Thr(GGU) m(6)t(6)A37 methyltransferase TsaA
MAQISYKPIGFVRSRFTSLEQVPPTSRQNRARGELHLYKKYAAGLRDIEGFSHLLVIWHMHRSPGNYKLIVHPRPRPDLEIGLFATRSPHRPNPIGVSVIEIARVKDNIIYFRGVDMLDRTPVLDIKPLGSDIRVTRGGWLRDHMAGG